MTIDEQLEIIADASALLVQERDELQRLRLVPCRHCAAQTLIGELTYVQTYWYEEPYGCTGGATWRPGEGQFVCPSCEKTNRLYFKKGTTRCGHPQAELLTGLKRFFKTVVESHDD